ncbi:MAG: phosphate ABC transporter substrate-binding protein PstS [Thermoleophilia bacterium]|nr:phosphate ABC transporter substrate-binding protein PstS [Thermoleophilia bacterium]
MNRTFRIALTASVAGVSLAAAGAAMATVTGSGATFPRIAYETWCRDSGICSYTAKGSTGGIRDFINGVVDFGASDALLSDAQNAELAQKRGGVTVRYFPTLLGAITVPINVPGIANANRVKLDGNTVGQIFDGTITKWNDSRITRQNRGVRFPDSPITVCVRSDGSGTSFTFSRYLTKVSPSFKQKVNFSQTPPWTAPNVIKQPGNAGVGNCVKSNQNSIGYVDLGDVIASGLTKNVVAVGQSRVIKGKRKVEYVLPSVKTISTAGNIRTVRPDLAIDVSASPTPGAYPIVGTTWILAYSNYTQAGKGPQLAEVRQFLTYAYSPAAQNRLAGLGFAPLPNPVLQAARRNLATLG